MGAFILNSETETYPSGLMLPRDLPAMLVLPQCNQSKIARRSRGIVLERLYNKGKMYAFSRGVLLQESILIQLDQDV